MALNPTDKRVKRYMESKDSDEVARRVALLYLLNAFNAYNRVMMKMMDREANKLMSADYEDLKAQCDKFLANPYIPENNDTD